MKITRVVEQVKQKGRYSIFVDGAYAFSVSETLLLDSHLASGQELSVQELADWKQQSSEDKVYMRALRYAAMRSRSTWELRTYLERKEASPSLVEYILNKLSDLRLIDDEAYAKSYVADQRLLRSASKLKLQQKLRAKRINSETIERAIGVDQAKERTALQAVIAKKKQQTKYRENETKLMQYLARQGFSYEDIKSALGNFNEV